MALLQADDGRTFECDRNTLVGRGLLDGISFDEPEGLDLEISSVHASLTWNAKVRRWELRDLGSHNGTFVDGDKVEPGDRAPLVEGSRVVFGRLGLDLIDDAPPPAHAICARTGEVRVGRNGALLLPDEGAPELVVLRTEHGWQVGPPTLLEDGDRPEARAIEGTVRVEAGQRPWQVRVPSHIRQTVRSQRSLRDFTLVLEVRQGGDRINLLLEHESGCITVPGRAHHEMLWLLARHRIADIEAGKPLAEQGWVDQEEIIREMRAGAADPISHLNVLIFRARQQVQPHAPADYKALVERASDRTGVLRIGSPRLRIDDVGAWG